MEKRISGKGRTGAIQRVKSQAQGDAFECDKEIEEVIPGIGEYWYRTDK